MQVLTCICQATGADGIRCFDRRVPPRWRDAQPAEAGASSGSDPGPGSLPGLARAPVAGVAAQAAALLVAVSARYGYHRDELYFLARGRHLAWGYPDQPPLVPLIARLMSDLDPANGSAGRR
jgi:hypothetical protein